MAQVGKPIPLKERLRRTLIGAPIPTSKAHHERLGPVIGLAVFSSDALSSVAYATEAILGILIMFSLGVLHLQLPITLGICALILIIAVSYNQTIHAYPNGGGSYTVASDNLGERAGLVAGAALLIDYILTVAVSIAAGVAALVSAFPALHGHLVIASLLFTALVAWANLRGVRESGTLFAIPTYGFVVSILTMLAFGIYKTLTHPVVPGVPVADPKVVGVDAGNALLFIILRSFAAGCTALTGIEAVSNGVQAFKAPESNNAAKTLRAMVMLLLTMFLGIGWLASRHPQLTLLPVTNPGYRTVVSQIASYAFGANSFGFYAVQIATALILILAANTAFADFPRLSSLIARDGFLPRSLARQGDRLVFHNGILILAVSAGLLIVAFKGELDHLLALYAVGVFTAFTLSQSGMVVHWAREQTPGWRRSAFVNGLGATLSCVVLCIIAYTKFTEGAWLVLFLIPAVYLMFKRVQHRYRTVARQLTLDDHPLYVPAKHTALILVPRVNRGILKALEYAVRLDLHPKAIHVAINDKALPELMRQWEHYGKGIPLEIITSPYRSLIQPVTDYVDGLLEADPDQLLTVIVAEAVSPKFIHRLLHENVAMQLKQAFAYRRNVVITNVRYQLD